MNAKFVTQCNTANTAFSVLVFFTVHRKYIPTLASDVFTYPYAPRLSLYLSTGCNFAFVVDN